MSTSKQSNIRYEDLIRSKLMQYGYPSNQIDSLTNQVIMVADDNGVDALAFLESKNGELSRDFMRELLAFGKGTYFTTTRTMSPKPNKFIRRQIINR